VGTDSERGYVIPSRLWAWGGRPEALRVALWVAALAIGAHHLQYARAWLSDYADTPDYLRRPSTGGNGHTQIDFGGQWVMGRMLVLGHGRTLYHRQVQWEIVRAGFPESDESWAQREESILPKHQRRVAQTGDDIAHDANRMMSWFMGADPPVWKTVGGAAAAPLMADPCGSPFAAIALQKVAGDTVTPAVVEEVQKPAVGGPLYPPIHAFLYAPLGLLDPHDAYSLFQVVALAFAYLAGLGVATLTRGKIWWSVASVAILLYPGCRTGLELGQNPTLSLSIVVWGWVLAARGRDWAGGAVWGLFAFKPVWGMAFFLVPLLMGRWRFCVGMVGTGAGLAALTLPVVGLQTWFDWLKVGQEAADLYNVSLNWISLSRDLQGIPRRFLHDFSLPESERETSITKQWAWGLWGVVFGVTILVYLLRADRRRPLGLGAAFLFFGAFLTCYRFMYYDILLSLVGMVALMYEPWRVFRTRVFGLDLAPHLPGPDRNLPAPAAPPDPLGPQRVGYLNSFPLTILAALYLLDNVLNSLHAEATFGMGVWASTTTSPGGSTGLATPRLRLETSLSYPWDTVLVIALWAWCGIRLVIRSESKASEDEADRKTAPPSG
jgi:arabinofuranan 3-O-arabinosyltransferase